MTFRRFVVFQHFTARTLIGILFEGKLSGIRRESVNYVGYYSQHEETMKNVIQNQVKLSLSLIISLHVLSPLGSVRGGESEGDIRRRHGGLQARSVVAENI